MFIETRYLRPHLGTFIKHLLFGVVLSLILGILLYLYTTANPLSFAMPRWWMALLLIPVVTAIVLTSGARQVELVINESDDLHIINEWVRDRFLPKKHRIKPNGARETILQSKKSFDRWFGGWFGSELISIQQKDDNLIIRGPRRLVNVIDEELRFESLQYDEV